MYVVITGASRGIGRDLALVYASHRYDLILTCKNNYDLLKKLKDHIESEYNVKVIIHKGDIYDDTNDDIKKVKSDVYILINNQGVADYNLLQDIDRDNYDDMMDTNITNPIFTTKYFVDDMIKRQQGVIVNISSIWGQIGAANESIYSATKGAIDSFTRSVAKELKDSKVDVVAFSLGMVDTDMNRHIEPDDMKYILSRLDDGKMYTPKQIAWKIYDTLSMHEYNTGDIIEVDNGLKKL